jgi:uncharacterized protein YkwD
VSSPSGSPLASPRSRSARALLRASRFAIAAAGFAAACVPIYDIAFVRLDQNPPRADGLSAPATPGGAHLESARRKLLEAVNEDRAGAGLTPVALDSLATAAAQGHARAMADDSFFSHYGLAGEAPYERLARYGHSGHVRENLFRWTLRGAAWRTFDPRRAERFLMDSPGHRATILDPARTHVGIGIAVDRSGSSVYVVQEFVAGYAELSAPRRTRGLEPLAIAGKMRDPTLRPLTIVLRAEPSRSWEAGRPPGGSYSDGGESVVSVAGPRQIDWHRDGAFAAQLPGGKGRPGGRLYGVVYVAPRESVERLLSGGGGEPTSTQWPGAAFVVEVE